MNEAQTRTDNAMDKVRARQARSDAITGRGTRTERPNHYNYPALIGKTLKGPVPLPAAETSQDPTTADQRDTRRKIPGFTGRVVLPVMLGAGILGISGAELASSPPNPIIAKAPRPDAVAKPLARLTEANVNSPNGAYEISINGNGKDGSIYTGLANLATAEGKNPRSTPVSEALNDESREIQKHIGKYVRDDNSSIHSNGEVVPGTYLDVAASSPVVDKAALNESVPQVVISKIDNPLVQPNSSGL
jgi:hypothetical protein